MTVVRGGIPQDVRWARPGPLVVIREEISPTASAVNPEGSVLFFAVGPAAVCHLVLRRRRRQVPRHRSTSVACTVNDLQVAKSLASGMENSAVCQTTDQIGPVLGSEIVASFDHLTGTRVRTRLFESVKEAGAAMS